MGFPQFTKQLSPETLSKLSNCDTKPLINLLEDLYREITTKDDLLRQKDEDHLDLLENNKQYRRDLCELRKKFELMDKDKIGSHEIMDNFQKGNKNNLATIANLIKENERLKLELKEQQELGKMCVCKPIDHLIAVSILGEQLNEYFKMNLLQERKIESLYDEIIYLQEENFWLENDYYILEDMHLNDFMKVSKQKYNDEFMLRKKRSNECQAYSQHIRSQIKSRENEIEFMITVRAKLLEMENQKRYADSLIEELYQQVNNLKDQLNSNQKFVEDSTKIFDSINRFEQQNIKLQKNVEAKDFQINDYEHQLNHVKVENAKLRQEIYAYQTDIGENHQKLQKIVDVNKSLQSELVVQKRNCWCSGKTANQFVAAANTKENDRLQLELNKKTVELNRTTDELHKIQKNRQLSSEDFRRLFDENSQLKQMIVDLKGHLSKANTSNEQKTIELEQAQNRLKDLLRIQNELNTELNTKTDIICLLNNEKSNLCLENEELSSKMIQQEKSNESREFQLGADLDALRKNNDTLSKAIKVVEQRNEMMFNDNKAFKGKNEQLHKEIGRNNEETTRLRERISILEDRENVFTNTLYNTQQELTALREKIISLQNSENEANKLNRQYTQIRNEYSIQIEKYQELTHKFDELKRIHSDMHIEYNSLEKDYNDILSIREKANLVLDNAKKGQNEHKTREREFTHLISKQRDHIKSLLDDRENLIKKMEEMHRDEIILKHHVESLQDQLPINPRSSYQNLYMPPYSQTIRQSRIVRYGSDSAINEADQTMKQVKKTIRKIYRTRQQWQHGLNNLNDD